MRLIDKEKHCHACKAKCDIFLTAKEMKLDQELNPVHVIYKKHEIICREHAPITHAINLVEGNAKMFVSGIHGKNIMLSILMPGNYIGLTAIFGSAHYAYCVSALSPCHTCQVDIGLVRQMYHNNSTFQGKLNQAFGKTMANLMSKLVSLNQKQIRAKVAESLLYIAQLFESNQFVLPLTRKELGELSAITGENAVRVLSEFRQEGIIKLQGKEVEILQPEILSKISASG
jgi:CRP/FNR family transcriptional regulator, polysaccharide utilization system transcription regulator